MKIRSSLVSNSSSSSFVLVGYNLSKTVDIEYDDLYNDGFEVIYSDSNKHVSNAFIGKSLFDIDYSSCMISEEKISLDDLGKIIREVDSYIIEKGLEKEGEPLILSGDEPC